MTVATTPLPAGWCIRTLVLAAGGDPRESVLQGGILRVAGVPQQSLDAAVAAYNHVAVVSDRAWTALRTERDRRLSDEVDRINAVRWSAMTAEQQAAWTAYRLALLDLPQATADPANPVWPVPPA